MTVGEICNREVIIATRETSLVEVAQLMRQHHVGSIVIVETNAEGNIPVGIITDRDLTVEILALKVPLDSATASDVMSRDLVTTTESDGLWDTIQEMRSRGIRRIPVVNQSGVLIGILSLDDVLELLSSELSDLVKLMAHEHQHEEATRTRP